MSSWGNLDNVTISGTVVVATANANAVLGVSTLFTTNVKAGDYLTIASNKYQVDAVIDDTHLYLTANSATNSSGVAAYLQQGPKYVANANVLIEGTSPNVYTIQNIYGIDKNEVDVPENKARGIGHSGWIHYNTYGTSQGETRYKSEVLVAMSKNFSANTTNVLFGTGAGQDANDDTVAADYLLYFTTLPADVSADTGNGTSILTVAASSPTGATIAYQWEENNTVAWASISDAGVYSGTNSNTLAISDVTGLDGYQYRVVISATGTGADSNTSTSATLTETTP